MSGQIDEDLLNLLFCTEKLPRVEIVHSLDQEAIDGLGRGCLQLGDDVPEIDLVRARRELSLQGSGRGEVRVESKNKLETDHRLLTLPSLEVCKHLVEGRHDPFLCLYGKPGVPWI